jgi:hypothetical protein
LEKQFDRGLFKRHIRYFEHRIYHIYNDIGDKSEYLILHIRLTFSDSYILINGTYTVCKSVHTFFKTTNSLKQQKAYVNIQYVLDFFDGGGGGGAEAPKGPLPP